MQLSFDTDRQFAIAGLHARLSTSKPFQSRMDYGVFWRNFERFMLWRAYDAESLTRITYSEEHSVPSWSWMAFNGQIGYHKAPFGKVIWTGDLTKPLTEGSLPSDHFKQGILAKARKVNTNKGDPLRLIVVDTPVATDFDEDLWRFIAIGEYEDSDRVGESLCCGLLIRPVFGVSSNVFQRAGAGTIRRACLSSTFEEINLM